MTQERPPTLTDAKGMGGMNALGGFEYQIWDALIRLPGWIKVPAFDGLGNELIEDIEARFFAPHAPVENLLDRFQAKSYQLTKQGLKDVFKSFKMFDSNFPGAARVHVLVTPSLPENLKWLARDTRRVRRARPFYAPFTDIQAASDAKLREDLIKEFGSDLGQFVSEAVDISLRSLPDQATAEIAFATAFGSVFPSLSPDTGKLIEAHRKLFQLCQNGRGGLISRAQILDILRDNVQTDLLPDDVLTLHVLSDQSTSRVDALEIDARLFAGGELPIPQPDCWQQDLLGPLKSTATWAKKRGVRRIQLSGSYRLSTALVVGYAFRSAIGFEIEISTKTEIWPTDLHGSSSGTSLPWMVTQPQQLLDNRLVVGIGILRDPSPGIEATHAGASERCILKAQLASAISNATEVQPSVRLIKTAIDQACAALKPSTIELFYSGPAAFAVALGHRWNGFPETRLHEYKSANGAYLHTATLG